MSEALANPWRDVRRAVGPYGERADLRDSRLDRFLASAGAGLARPFSRALRDAAHVAALVEREQAAVDALGEKALVDAAASLRAPLLRQGFTPALVARAFAMVRTAASRTLGLRHFPAQVMGGHAMLHGRLAEMGTGEGKTLAATLPAATAALAGLPVHVVTVNEYLATRDGNTMAPLYAALGLATGIVRHDLSPDERRSQYAADICHVTNSELGFDYLRDTLVLKAGRDRGRLLLEKFLARGDRVDQLVLRGLHYAIVDEADSVMIDEARTPLVIATERDGSADAALYAAALAIADALEGGVDYRLDAGERSAILTDAGRARLRTLADALPEGWRSVRASQELVHQALQARHFFERDTHYVLQEGKVQIVDEYSGRILADRSWERGLHQLIEAKEGCEPSAQRTTLARITYQRLFRRYLRLAGMTGTGLEVAPELKAVFGLETVVIPPHRPLKRVDQGTRTYATTALKWQAVAERAAALQQEGRAVLVGTRSVAASEELARHLVARELEPQVLNARQDAQEAEIVARAGEPGRVTIATNMAGRGTDIALDHAVSARGGLHVILTEFHESGRIDRQLYGRCARQGEPGSHEAITALDDEIYRRHAPRFAASLALRHGNATGPLPAWQANALRAWAQASAERANSHTRRATLESDRRTDTALAFTGRVE
jgi:preprotein translocase subunit SecA